MQTATGFFNMIEQFIGENPLYVVAGVGCCLYMYLLEKHAKRTGLIAVFLLLIGVYNPISYRILGDKAGFSVTYYRFLWIIPYSLLFVYALYELIRQIEGIKSRLALVMVVCATILCMNIDKEELKLPDSAYQIPIESIEVAEQIEILMSQNEEEDVVVLADVSINHTIRQYDAHIAFPFEKFDLGMVDPALNEETTLGLMSMLMNDRNDISEEAIEEIVMTNKIDYLVINMQNMISLEYMQEMDWRIVAATSTYYILAR